MRPNLPPPGYAAPLAAEDHPDQLRGDPDYMLTLARGLHVIRAFGTRRQPQTAAELSRRAGLPRRPPHPPPRARCLHGRGFNRRGSVLKLPTLSGIVGCTLLTPLTRGTYET